MVRWSRIYLHFPAAGHRTDDKTVDNSKEESAGCDLPNDLDLWCEELMSCPPLTISP